MFGALAAPSTASDEPIAHAPITALALYKNGLTSVTRTITPPPESPFLITGKFDPAHGSLWIDSDEPVRIKTIPENPNAMLIEGPSKPFEITYMSKGVSWAPSYRINLLDDKRLRLTMSTVIRNEMMSFRNAEVQLISGFPSLEFANRFSLIVPGITLNSFFQQLASGNPASLGGAAVAVMSQMMSPRAGESRPQHEATNFDIPDMKNEGIGDIHYRGIGRVSLGKDQSMHLKLEEAETPYRRIVEWDIPARRNGKGDLTNAGASDLWDTIRFANPFASPLTTAAAQTTEGSKILGQSILYWTNPGQTINHRVTKSLSVNGTINETEVDRERPFVFFNPPWNNVRYRNPDTEGEIKLKNYRSSPADVVVKLGFCGEFVSSSREPSEHRVLPSPANTVNKSNHLFWNLTLAPGEEISINYTYSVLIPHP